MARSALKGRCDILLDFAHTAHKNKRKAMTSTSLAVCEHCDAAHRRVPLRPGNTARCVRCGAELYQDAYFDLNLMLALTASALIVFMIANAFPIVSIQVQGASNEATLWRAILDTADSGFGSAAALAAATVFFFPLAQIVLIAYVLLPLRLGATPRHFALAMRALRHLQPWSMTEVFMLGVLVSVVKLGSIATVVPGPGLYGFLALTVLLTLLASFDLRALWQLAPELRT